MDTADSGEVRLNGIEICGLSEDERAKLRLTQIGFVFQQMNMLKNLNIIDNIMLPGKGLNKGKESGRELKSRAMLLMNKMGISEISERKITEVSGGQLQRACICRSMINKPRILFADEPTGALNQSAAREVIREFTRLNREGTTILMVTHDSRISACCGRILYLLDGRIRGEFCPDSSMTYREREAAVTGWLTDMGW